MLDRILSKKRAVMSAIVSRRRTNTSYNSCNLISQNVIILRIGQVLYFSVKYCVIYNHQFASSSIWITLYSAEFLKEKIVLWIWHKWKKHLNKGWIEWIMLDKAKCSFGKRIKSYTILHRSQSATAVRAYFLYVLDIIPSFLHCVFYKQEEFCR